MQSTDAHSNAGLVTVLGATGFIGSHLVEKLKKLGMRVFAPRRDEEVEGRDLGRVIYCIGLTADFRERPIETVEAHVCRLARVLRDCDFQLLLYMSSTRLYKSNPAPAREENAIQVTSLDPDDLYNASTARRSSRLPDRCRHQEN